MGEEFYRGYLRDNHFHTIGKISIDGRVWKDIEIDDLSAGGLQFYTDYGDSFYKVGDVLWFSLKIHSFLTDFALNVQGIILREERIGEHHTYGVAFKNLSKDLKIRIDESVRNDRPIGRNPYSLDW